MKILVIDNYDSFTFNLVHYLEDLDCEVTVWRNDAYLLSDVAQFDKILLSPGPGIPSQAGLLLPTITQYAGKIPMLGICLGQQAIAEAFGGKLVNLEKVHHGVPAEITVTVPDVLFQGLPSRLTVGRYHSWTVDRKLPDVLEATSIDANGEIMSLRHRAHDLRGVQFHPESILTPRGKDMLANWIGKV